MPVFPIIFNKFSLKLNAIDKKIALSHILSLRLEDRCSLENISISIKRLELSNNLVVFISNALIISVPYSLPH